MKGTASRRVAWSSADRLDRYIRRPQVTRIWLPTVRACEGSPFLFAGILQPYEDPGCISLLLLGSLSCTRRHLSRLRHRIPLLRITISCLFKNNRSGVGRLAVSRITMILLYGRRIQTPKDSPYLTWTTDDRHVSRDAVRSECSPPRILCILRLHAAGPPRRASVLLRCLDRHFRDVEI